MPLLVATILAANAFLSCRAEASDAFLSLPDQTVTLTESEDSHTIDLGRLRAGCNYEVKVKYLNSRSRAFLPTRAHVSCNCIVGSFADKGVDPGSYGELLLRIRTKTVAGNLGQQAVIESESGSVMKLEVRGSAIHGLEFSKSEIRVPSLKQGDIFDAALQPQFDDVDLDSVVIEPLHGNLSLSSFEIRNGSAHLKLKVERKPSTSFLSESFKLKYKSKDRESLNEESIELFAVSNEPSIKPTFVRLSGAHETDLGLVFTGDIMCLNFPDSFGFNTGDHFDLVLEKKNITLQATVKSSKKLSSVVKCQFEVAIPREVISETSTGEWLKLKVRFNGNDLGWFRCVVENVQ